jgi:hypothetical protein
MLLPGHPISGMTGQFCVKGKGWHSYGDTDDDGGIDE